jgi:hypothetical protein
MNRVFEVAVVALAVGSAGIATLTIARGVWLAPDLGPAPPFAAADGRGATWSTALLWGEPYVVALGAVDPITGVRALAFGGSAEGWVALPASSAPTYAVPEWIHGTPALLIDASGNLRTVVGLPLGRDTLDRRLRTVRAEARHPWLAQLDGFVCRR